MFITDSRFWSHWIVKMSNDRVVVLDIRMEKQKRTKITRIVRKEGED